MTIKLQLVKV